jgi:D-alanyl-lipoteichoic acid acyltransferase DltB (MBOAT superfamily)
MCGPLVPLCPKDQSRFFAELHIELHHPSFRTYPALYPVCFHAASPTALPLDIYIAATAFERIIVGFFKVNVLSFFMLIIQTSFLSCLAKAQTIIGHAFMAVTIVAIYPLYNCCNFSGYIDIVIGIARVLRLQLPENFNHPLFFAKLPYFWTRWHLTLSNWLRTHVLFFLMR